MLTALPNEPATLALALAAMLEGVVQVPVPAETASAELLELADDADPHACVVVPGSSAEDVLGERRHGRAPVHGFSTGALGAVAPAEPSAAWPRTRPMSYTSGTTGRRKGVHVGVHEEAWGEAVVADELAAFDHRHGARHLVVSPLHHSGPFRFAAVTALAGGDVVVLPRFDVGAWLDALRRLRPTSMFCVPTHLHRLLAHPDLHADDLSSLTLLAHAGAPCPVSLKERILELAPEGSVWEFYGATEGQFTVCPPEVWEQAPGTVGHARAERRLELRDVGADGVGTVWVEAPWHARWTYWRDPGATAAAWDGDRFTVGDLGHLDGDRRLFLDGRPGDLVISGGVNVYPAEVERALLEDERIAEAVVFGVPDTEWGERVVAAVIPRDDAEVSGQELRRRLGDRLAAPKVPKAIEVVDELPRTSTGKVRRGGLADALGLDG